MGNPLFPPPPPKKRKKTNKYIPKPKQDKQQIKQKNFTPSSSVEEG